MKKYAVFENVIFKGKLEWKFYFFCLRINIPLIRFLPGMLFCTFKHWLKIVDNEKYLTGMFRFLSECANIKILSEKFSDKLYGEIFLIPKLSVVSEYPSFLLKPIAKSFDFELTANEYDFFNDCFVDFKKCEEMVEGEYACFGTMSSPLMENATECFYVRNGKVFSSKIPYIISICLKSFGNLLVICVYSAFLGIVSLFLATVNFYNTSTMFEHYFAHFGVVILNILPIILFSLLLYFIFNSTAVSVSVMTITVLLFSGINYFKIQLRDDPLLFSDLSVTEEAAQITQNYKLSFSAEMIALALALISVCVLICVFVNHKIRLPYVRISMVAVIIIAVVVLYNTVYTNQSIYNSCTEEDIIDSWSSTEKYQIRGFIYPLIYSSVQHQEQPNDSYDEAKAIEILDSYESEDIPDDKKVNLISVMLESYSDFQRFEGVDFDVNPYQFFNELREKSVSGTLITDIFAGGTIATERSFLTGLNYISDIRDNLNSFPWYFKKQGYVTGGSHPGYSWFYNRENINSWLGFDKYYFNENRFFEINDNKEEARDVMLLDEVYKDLKETNAKNELYYSFNVSYEGHGPYSSEEPIYSQPYIYNYGFYEDDYVIINNYFEVIMDVDIALRDFVEDIDAYKEPVVLIIFGDHMPLMDNEGRIYRNIGADFDLSTEEGLYNYYGVPYVIYANKAAKNTLGSDFVGKGRTIGPYFLMSEFYELAGYKGDSFAQYISNVSLQLPVMNVEDIYIDGDGNIIRELDEEQQKLVDEYDNVSYYWKHHFQYDSTK